MYSNDYVKELSDRPVVKEMPTVVAALIFAAVAAGAWFGYQQLKAYAKSEPPPPIEAKK